MVRGDRERRAAVSESALEEFVQGDDVAATGTVTAWPQSSAEPTAVGATLLAEVARLAVSAFVDDVLAAGPGQAGSSEFVGELLQAVAAAEGDHLATMRAVGGAPGLWPGPADRAGSPDGLLGHLSRH